MGNYEREILEKVINYRNGVNGFLRDYRGMWDREINTEINNNDLLRESMWLVDYGLVLELLYHLHNSDWENVDFVFKKASDINTDLLVTICSVLGIDY